MEYQKARITANILFAVAVVFLLSLYLFTESKLFNTILPIMFILAFGAVIAGAIILVKFYKCPHCHNRIRAWGRVPEHCPNCGEAI